MVDQQPDLKIDPYQFNQARDSILSHIVVTPQDLDVDDPVKKMRDLIYKNA